MTVRLHWNLVDHQEGGAFTLRGTPLYLVRSAEGVLDRLHQAPGDRDGFTVVESEGGNLKLEAHGSCRLDAGSGPVASLELAFGSQLKATSEDFTWELKAEGKAEVQDPLVGTELGGHKVVARLGNGAMGVVYRAVQINLDREVALKVLDPKAAKASPLAVASFKREAVAAGRLSHPNLVQVYDVGQDRGLHFFSMELVPAGDLEDRIKEAGPLGWHDALVHLLDAAEALHFAQEHHLVHRDVKPENLMLTVDGRTKLADLGMATTRGMVEKQGAGGTPHFLAPEAVSGEHADHRSDFYSLGCTLYRLLTGSTPYQGASVREILRAHRDDPIPDLKEQGVEVPGGVQELLAWLMAKDPAERPQDAQEIVDELHDLLDGKRSKGLVLGLSVVAIAAIAVSLFFAFKSPPETDPEKVIVEVDSGAAEQERQRAERLERELAFTSAMAAAEGPDRITALEAFLAEHPGTEFQAQAEAELARLDDLPETPPEMVEVEDPFAAERAALQDLEQTFLPLLESRQFGLARAQLTTSSLGAEWQAPLWSRLETSSLEAFGVWEAEHGNLLAAEDWSGATDLRDTFRQALVGPIETPAAWTERLTTLETSATTAKADAERRDYREARLAVLAAMRDGVLPALDRWAFAEAAQAMRQAQESCPHGALQEALREREALLLAAAETQEALFARLQAVSTIDIIEARDGKRAFATGASEEGLTLLVQVSGERIERLDPWLLYANPEDLANLLEAILGEDQDPEARRAMMVVLASRTLAQELAGWTTIPGGEATDRVARTCRAWLDLFTEEPFAPGSAGAQEVFAIQEFAQLAEALQAKEDYAALLHAQALQEHFSLLAVWASDGASTWGFHP